MKSLILMIILPSHHYRCIDANGLDQGGGGDVVVPLVELEVVD